jgi:hypothetical protein
LQSGEVTVEQSISAEKILQHPKFAGAKREHLRALTRLFLDDRAITRLMVDASTITLRALLIGFHAVHDDDDPRTWATIGRVQSVIVDRGLASRRRLDDLISRFQVVGYLTSVPLPSDRRIRLLKPTQRLIDHDRDHLQAYHRFLHELYPERGYNWRGPDFHMAVRRTAFYELDKAMAFMRHSPFMSFLARDAGYLAFLVLANAELEKSRLEPTFTWVASRLGVSRTHVRNIFVEAHRLGYVELGSDRKRIVRINAVLWEAYDRFLADIHADQDVIAQAAFTAIANSRRSTDCLR